MQAKLDALSRINEDLARRLEAATIPVERRGHLGA
jgi:hypothetical protein